VVIAIIAILAAMLLPALGKAKVRAQGIQCMNGSRQLALAMNMYTLDFADMFPPNPDDANTVLGHNWCAGNVSGGMAGGGASAATFDPDILKDPTLCLVAPYIAGNVGIFSCPADSRMGTYQGKDTNRKGTTVRAARSVSMSQSVGTVCMAFTRSHSHTGAPNQPTPGGQLQSGNSHDNPWATFGRTRDFTRISPAQVILTLDENPWSINDAAFAICANPPQWVDYPSSAHNNAAGFSFCDGHTEMHKWKGSLVALKTSATTQRIGPNMTGDMTDWIWLSTHATVKVGP
jgi:prepilin-type processing-associated H-X9-DG protein